jgi:SAM-dependent methyltransferase
MMLALAAADLHPGHRVLDVGAGTGGLYDFLEARDLAVHYYAFDPSGAMLEQSRIPVACRFQGRVEEIPGDWPFFDRVFVLGVSTYLSDAELRSMLEFLRGHLAPGGRLLITFTHAGWWGLPFRRVLGMLVPSVLFPNRLLGKSTPFYPRRVELLPALFGEHWKICAHQWLNTSIPLKRIFPGLAFPVSVRLRSFLPEFWVSRLSSDFIVFAEVR